MSGRQRRRILARAIQGVVGSIQRWRRPVRRVDRRGIVETLEARQMLSAAIIQNVPDRYVLTESPMLLVARYQGDAPSHYNASIAWGDGTSQNVSLGHTINGNGGFAYATHPFAEAGNYSATLTISDSEGDVSTTSFQVHVGDTSTTLASSPSPNSSFSRQIDSMNTLTENNTLVLDGESLTISDGGTYTYDSLTMENGSSITITNGTLVITGSASISDSSIAIANGSVMQNMGTVDWSNSDLTVSGVLENSSTWNWSGGTLTLNSGGLVANDGYGYYNSTYTYGTLNWASGDLAISSGGTFSNGGMLLWSGTISSAGSPIYNIGTIEWMTTDSSNISIITNGNGGMVEFDADTTLTSVTLHGGAFGLGSSANVAIGDVVTLDNCMFYVGQYQQVNLSGSGVTIDDSAWFLNQGTVTANGNVLVQNNGMLDNYGTLNWTAGGLTLGQNGHAQNLNGLNWESSGDLAVNAGGNFGNSGIMHWDNGSLIISSNTTLANAGQLDVDGGTLAVSGTLENQGIVNWDYGCLVISDTGTVSNESNGTFTWAGGEWNSIGVFVNCDYASFSCLGGDLYGSIINEGNATINYFGACLNIWGSITNSSNLNWSGNNLILYGNIANSGNATLYLSGSNLDLYGSIANSGNATLYLSGSNLDLYGSITNSENATLSCSGSYLALINGGTLYSTSSAFSAFNWNGSSLTVGNGCIFYLSGGAWISWSGNLTVVAGGYVENHSNLNWCSGNLWVDGNFENDGQLAWSSGTLGGSGIASNHSYWDWSGGTIDGHLVNCADGYLEWRQSGAENVLASISNSGRIVLCTNFDLSNLILTGGIYEIIGGYTVKNTGGLSLNGATLANNGVLEWQTGDTAPLANINNGISVIFERNINLSNAILGNGYGYGGTFVIASGVTATNAGGLVLTGTTLVNNGTLDWQSSSTGSLASVINYGVINLAANIDLSNISFYSGTYEIVSNAMVTNTGGLAINSATLINYGTLAWQTSDTSQLANITNNGTILLSPTADVSGISLTGTYKIAGNIMTTAASSSEVDLGWANCSGASGYVIERSDDGINFTQIGSVGSGVITYSDTGLAEGSAYSYRISAVVGGNSLLIGDTTVGNSQVLAPTYLTETAISATEVDLCWTNNSTTASNIYVYQQGPSDSGYVLVATLAPDQTYYSIQGLMPETAYSFAVTAVNSNGVASSTSDANLSVTTDSMGFNVSTNTPIVDEGNSAMVSFSAASTVKLWIVDWGDGTKQRFSGSVSSAIHTYWAPQNTSITVTAKDDYRTYDAGQCAVTVNNVAPTVTILTGPSTAVPGQPYTVSFRGTDSSSQPLGAWMVDWGDGQSDSLPGDAWYATHTYTSGSTAYTIRVKAVDSSDVESDERTWGVTTTATPSLPAPSNVVVNSYNLHSPRVLMWMDNSMGENGFEIEQSTDGGSFQSLATVAANVTSYTLPSFTDGSQMRFRVRAYQGNTGSETYSNYATTPIMIWEGYYTEDATLEVPQVTSAVLYENILGALTNWTDIERADGVEVRFNYTDVDDQSVQTIFDWNQGTNIIQVLRDLKPNTGVTVAFATYDTDTKHYSAWSTGLTLTQQDAPPSSLITMEATSGSVTTTSAQFAWQANSSSDIQDVISEYYEVEIVEAGGNYSPRYEFQNFYNGYPDFVNGSFTITNLNPNTQYQLRFRMTFDFGVGQGVTAWSDPVEFTTLANTPAAPSCAVSKAKDFSSVELTWTDNSDNETGFDIQYSPDGGTNWTDVAGGASANTTYCLVSGLKTGKTYQFRVRATNAAGSSNWISGGGVTLTAPDLNIGVSESLEDIDPAIVRANTSDDDSDGIIDRSDGYDADNSAAFTADDSGPSCFHSITLTIPAWIDLTQARVSFTYPQASLSTSSSSGILRLWRSNSSTRDSNNLVGSGTSYTPWQLGVDPITRTITLYVEATDWSLAPQSIKASVTPTPGATAGEDSVKVLPLAPGKGCTTVLDSLTSYFSSMADVGSTASGSNFGGTTGLSGLPAITSLGWNTYMLQLGSKSHVYFQQNGSQQPQLLFNDGQLSYDAQSNQYTYTDTDGNSLVFNGCDSSTTSGKLVRSVNTNGQTVNLSYDSTGKLTSLDEQTSSYHDHLTLAYTTNESLGLQDALTSVSYNRDNQQDSLGSLTYTYYGNNELGGVAGKLKTLVETTGQQTQTKYYRYYQEGESGGRVGDLKYAFEGSVYERLVGAVGDPTTATDEQIAPYAGSYYEYDADGRVTVRQSQQSGCSVTCGGKGTFSYVYTTSSFPDAYNSWHLKTTEYEAGYDFNNPTTATNTRIITYTNYAGQIILKVTQQATPTAGVFQNIAYDWRRYDSNGRETMSASGAAIIGYDESKADLVDYYQDTPSHYQFRYLSDTQGLITLTAYYDATTATATTPGGVQGYFASSSIEHGEFGTPILQSQTTYFAHSGGGATIYPTAQQISYVNDDGTGQQITSYSYGWANDSTHMVWQTITNPVVATSHNGSGEATSQTTVYDSYGRAIWQMDAQGYLTYTQYDDPTGAVIKQIVDVDTSKTSEFADLPNGWATPTGGGLHLVTTYEVDELGRTLKQTDPSGRVTYTIYNDANHEVRTYRGWNSATNSPTGPIEVTREDQLNGYSETLTSSATPTVDANGRPTGQEVLDASNIQSLTRSYRNAGGQTVYTDQYFSLAGVTYSTAKDLGTQGVNYLRTTYSYNRRGWLKRTQNANGTITFTNYDNLGRAIATYIGTDDNNGTWKPGQNPSDPVNMVQISSQSYDADGNVSQSTSYASATSSATTTYHYDWRDRLTDSKAADGLVTKYIYGNLGQTTLVQTYVDANSNWVIDAGELRSQSINSYDDLGRVYQSSVYEIDSITHQATDRLTSNTWYDGRGNVIKMANANGLFTKYQYDGAGRLTASYTSYDTDESDYAEAGNVIGDTVIEQNRAWYDADGNAVVQANYKRLESDLTSTGVLTAANSYATSSVAWYDQADRQTTSATIGHESGSGTRYVFATDGTLIDTDADGIPDIAQGTPMEPNSSDDYIVARVEYDAAGNVWRQTDNAGRISQTDHDLLGRTTRTISNYVDGTASETESETDQITQYLYDSSGRLAIQRAYNPKGSGNGVELQDTRYLYEDIHNASLQTNVLYPDSSDTDSTGTDQVKYTYDYLGRKTSSTDQRGVVHSYSYDPTGRLLADTVTDLGRTDQHVDGSIRRIAYAYDDQGRVLTVSSYDAVSGGNVVNQIAYTYDGWGNVIKTQQSHSGAVTSITPSTQYIYQDDAVDGEAKYNRLVQMIYPNGRVIGYGYSGTAVSDALSRVDSITSNGDTIATYSYLGTGTMVSVSDIQVSGGLTLSYNADANYGGWDRFGQIKEQAWRKNDGTIVDGYSYTYDRAGNRIAKTNLVNSAFSEAYSYDGLNRLTAATRDGVALANWSLDAVGNWSEYTSDGTTQTRSSDAANETTSISGTWVDPVYDAAGNLTTMPTPGNESVAEVAKYDAWNRLTELRDGNENLIAQYAYDGQNRRIAKTVDTDTQDYYYDEQYQAVETRTNGNTSEQTVWGQDYVDSAVVHYSYANGTVSQTAYFTHEANYDVTGTVDASTSTVINRFIYTPYGARTVLTATWTAGTTDISLGHQGLFLDVESGLYYNRARYLHTSLGTFIARDYLGYVDGMNVYLYVRGNPMVSLDPNGMDAIGPAPDPTKDPAYADIRSRLQKHSDDIALGDGSTSNRPLFYSQAYKRVEAMYKKDKEIYLSLLEDKNPQICERKFEGIEASHTWPWPLGRHSYKSLGSIERTKEKDVLLGIGGTGGEGLTGMGRYEMSWRAMWTSVDVASWDFFGVWKGKDSQNRETTERFPFALSVWVVEGISSYATSETQGFYWAPINQDDIPGDVK